MKKIIFIVGLFLYQTTLFSQTAYSGILDHTNSYFTINPYNSTYDDGTYARIFYDGNTRRLNFWNSDNNSYTNLRAGIINSYGYISVDKSGSYRVSMNGQSDGYIAGRNDNVEKKFVIHSNGPTYFNGGNVGIGTDTPGQKLEIYNPNLFNANMEAQSQDHISLTSTTIGEGNYYGGITWKSSGRRRAAITAVQENTDSDFIGLAFFTQGTNAPGPMYESMRIARSGNVGIGTTTPDSKLTVAGNIHSREVKVTVNAGADFVFEDNYNLPTLEEVQQFIQENGHLPEIASAKEMETNGIYLAEMNIKLLQKIEELTLYAIEQEKEIENLKKLTAKVSYQGEEIETLKKILNQLIYNK